MTEPTIRTGTPEDFLRLVVHFDLVFGEFSWPMTAHNTLHF